MDGFRCGHGAACWPEAKWHPRAAGGAAAPSPRPAEGLAISQPSGSCAGLPEQPARGPHAGHAYRPSKLTPSITGPPPRGQAPCTPGPAAATNQRPNRYLMDKARTSRCPETLG